ncbi:Dal81p LALA0_S04e09846g [Lachancea lanzarotensis]|uniref:LALA0S04e09846g1_1 n=1 Tax=Lachancea lanzarotensis TaxID=1245769 RepID=A0A0C7N6L6_9SACH|nr:uncharacterized protein LALA0_S04e09846g [Lachancea lanzarotensis]CEP62189.1 LALA0S04e09846g1_1 [Lachancea lanzarotensis]
MSNQQTEAEEPWNPNNTYDQGTSNVNHSMLNLNDDYANILSNLAHGASPILKEGSGTGQKLQKTSKSPGTASNGHSTGNNDKQPNLDLLLQHYQELFSRSGGNNNGGNDGNSGNTTNRTGQDLAKASSSVSPPSNNNTNTLATLEQKSVVVDKPCDHCRRRQIKCVRVPDLSNCVQCETKGIKCGYSKSPATHQASDTPRDISKRNRVDENVNVHELLKRTKPNNNNDASTENYTDILLSLDQAANEKHKRNSEKSSISGVGNLSSPYMMFDSPGQNEAVKSSANTIQTGNSPSNLSTGTNYNNGQQKLPYVQPPIQYPRSSFYVGPTSVFDINLVNQVKLDKIDQVQLSKTLALRKVAPDVQFLLRDDLNQALYMKQEQEVDMVEKLVHPHGKILVDIFFKLIHPQFPILHERVFLEKYSRSYRELTAPLLAALYSLSLQWWDFHPQLVGFAKPDVTEQLNQIALRTFFDVIERPKLSIIQTGLLILQCRSESSSNWAICSEVVALAEDLGLGVDCQDWRLPRWERGLRRRLAWAVWLEDKWTSMMEARHSHLILGRNWLVKMLTDEDFPATSPVISGSSGASHFNSQMLRDVTSPVSDRSMLDLSPTEEDFRNSKMMFQYMISLSIILGEVLDTFYTLGALQTVTKIEQVLKLAKPLQLKMREWYHSLPPQLSMNTLKERKFNSNASLTLSYFAVELTLHRKIITTLNSDTSPELVKVCRLAAKTRLVAAIEFIRDLKFEHINSFWYTCSTGNLTLIGTFSALLFVTAPSRQEAIIFRDSLRNYVWILRMNSKSFEKARHGLERIHMLLAQIPGLLTDETARQQSRAAAFAPPTLSPLAHQQIAQSPYVPPGPSVPKQNSTQSVANQFNGLPSDILHQLASIQGNMPFVNEPNAIQTENVAVNERRREAGVFNDLNRISPAESSPGEKESPRMNLTVKGESGGSPNISDQVKETDGSSDSAAQVESKSRVLTPQSNIGTNGRGGKAASSNDDHSQSGAVFDHQEQALQASPTSTEESRGQDKPLELKVPSNGVSLRRKGDGEQTPVSQQEAGQEKPDSSELNSA